MRFLLEIVAKEVPPTDISDIIGFIISLVAVLFLITRSVFGKRRREQDPDEDANDEDEQKETLKQFLKSLEVDMKDLEKEEERPKAKKVKPSPPPLPKPHRKVADEYHLQTNIEQRKLVTAIEKRRLETAVEARKLDFGLNIVSDDLKRSNEAYTKQFTHTEPPSHGYALISRMKSKKEMVILQEILNPPKAFGSKCDRF